jgi:hypothetical protein
LSLVAVQFHYLLCVAWSFLRGAPHLVNQVRQDEFFETAQIRYS